MNAYKCFASTVLALSLTGLSASALAGELPPPSADRVNDNAPAKTSDDERSAKNAVYLELLGNGGLYSVNYERALMDRVTARIGFSYLSLGASSTDSTGQQTNAKLTFITAPVMANYLVGDRNHNLELGAGALLVYAGGEVSGSGTGASAEGVGVAGTATVGYRYQPVDGGFLFKAGFTPIFNQNGFAAWGGLSLGGAF